MKKEINVYVSGPCGSGKSAIAEIIRQSLYMFGSLVKFNDDNGHGNGPEELPGVIKGSIVERMKSMKESGVQIGIRSVNTHRSGFNDNWSIDQEKENEISRLNRENEELRRLIDSLTKDNQQIAYHLDKVIEGCDRLKTQLDEKNSNSRFIVRRLCNLISDIKMTPSQRTVAIDLLEELTK